MTRADTIRAVAQQAHDNGDCVCCMDDTDLVFTRNEIIPSDTITITISREDAEAWQAEAYNEPVLARMVAICSAALEAQHEYDNSLDLQVLLRKAALKGER